MTENKSRLPSAQLALNGTPIYLNNINMTATVKHEQEDMSGSKSSTKTSNKGIKAKEVKVQGIIPYAYREWLTTVFKLAESIDNKGNPLTYRISAIIADVINMREVQFSEGITVQEAQNGLWWEVSFTLREVNSVAEKREKRIKKPKVKTQSENAPLAKSNKQLPTEQKSASKEQESEKGGENDMSVSGRINQGDFAGALEAMGK